MGKIVGQKKPKERLLKGPYKPTTVGTMPSTNFNYCNGLAPFWGLGFHQKTACFSMAWSPLLLVIMNMSRAYLYISIYIY